MHPITPPKPRENVTRQGPPPGGGQRQQVQSELLVNVVNVLTTGQTQFLFDVTNPSSRLSLLLAVTYVPNTQEDIPFPTSGPTAWTLSLDAWVQLSHELKSPWTRGNRFAPSLVIPTTYEVPTTLVRKWRGTVTAPNPSTGTAPGNLYVTAIWEPAPGESNITDAELAKLFQAAYITVLSGGQVNNGGG